MARKQVVKASPDVLLKEIFDAGRLGSLWEEHEEAYRTFGDLVFEGRSLATFLRNAKTLHKQNKAILETVSEEDLWRAIVSRLRPLYDDRKLASVQGLWKGISRDLLDSPIGRFHILHEIQGIELERPSEVLKLGPFRIYDFESHRATLTSRVRREDQTFWPEPAPNFLIEISVEARDAGRAYEIANEQFVRFERLLNFMLARSDDRIEVGIVNYRGTRRERFYAFTEHGSGGVTKRAGPIESLQIDHEFFRQTDTGFNRLWELAGTTRNEFERRLLLAAEWAGQSYAERGRPMAFLKAAISLETLFTPHKDAIITPSILSALSESVAMLLQDAPDTRLQLERRMKKLYERRSSIAHAGSSEVDVMELQEIQEIARACILTILMTPRLSRADSLQTLADLIKLNKYAGPPVSVAPAAT